jgi:hypothetical protein
VAFIFNIDSVEKLENFIDTKGIENEWISYSFWGAFNGFSNLSGNFTRSFFTIEGELMQKYIDKYLYKYVDIVANSEKVVNHTFNEHLVKNENSLEKVINIYEKLVVKKDIISIQDFINVLNVQNEQLFYEKLKTTVKINKRDAKTLFNKIKKYLDHPPLFE